MQRKISFGVDQIKGWGVDIQLVLERMRDMKAELEALGCKVDIRVCGEKLRPPAKKAGNGTRTRDILLGNNALMGVTGVQSKSLTIYSVCLHSNAINL